MAEAVRQLGATEAPDTRLYWSLAEAATVAPFTVDQLQRKMRNGTLIQGVHFTRPLNSRPLIIRAAFLKFLAGEDAPLRARRPRSGPVNWDRVGGA